jgi:hypothetical protein
MVKTLPPETRLRVKATSRSITFRTTLNPSQQRVIYEAPMTTSRAISPAADTVFVGGSLFSAGWAEPRRGGLAVVGVLDRDPFAGSTDRMAETRVSRTYVAGELVHHAEG